MAAGTQIGTDAPIAEVEAAIRRFLASSKQPALWEPGEEPLALNNGNYSLEVRSGRLVLQAWDDKRVLARRIKRISRVRARRLELEVERLARRSGCLVLVDLARGERSAIEHHAARLVLRERLRVALARQYPNWRIAEISAEPNLEESLSPAYPRALLRQGHRAWAALMAPDDAAAADGALSFGLIWLDYLRRREKRVTVEGLALFLPDGREPTTCLRLAWLDPDAARCHVWAYTPEGGEDVVDPTDYGNLDTALDHAGDRPLGAHDQIQDWVEHLRRIPGVEIVTLPDDALSLRVRGLEFARWKNSSLRVGVRRRERAERTSLAEVEQIAVELARLRSHEAADRLNPAWRLQPERWLESQVRAQLTRIDATLLPEPIYGQAPAIVGGDRGVLDLLAVDHAGRLAVLELKATADVHLPLQALDYWLRVRWHLERGEFQARGYFPGIALKPDPPRLLLIAPALEFHPTTETILRYFRSDIEVERIGLGVEWRKEVQIVFRARGAQSPDRRA
jgi:hypothetical protein